MKLTTDKHEASRGLSATAELLVLAIGLHIHQRTKFLFLPNLGDMGVQKLTKWRLLIPYTPPSRKIIYVALVSVNVSQHTKF